MADRVAIQGGPADGMTVAPGERFVHLEVVVLKRSASTPGSGLYELRDGAYEYIGGRRSVCECGAVFQRAEGGAERQPCPLCASANSARSVPYA